MKFTIKAVSTVTPAYNSYTGQYSGTAKMVNLNYQLFDESNNVVGTYSNREQAKDAAAVYNAQSKVDKIILDEVFEV